MSEAVMTVRAHRPDTDHLTQEEIEAIHVAAETRAPKACETCGVALPEGTEQKPGSYVVAQSTTTKGRVECLDCFVRTEREAVVAAGRGYLYATRYHGRSATSFITLNRKFGVWGVPFAVRAQDVMSPVTENGARVPLTRLVGYMIGPDGKLWGVAGRFPRDMHLDLTPDRFLFVDTWRLAPANARRVARRHKLTLTNP